MKKVFVIRTLELIGHVLYLMNGKGWKTEFIKEAMTFETKGEAIKYLTDSAALDDSVFEIVELYFLPRKNEAL